MKMINKLKDKVQNKIANINYLEEKKRFLLFSGVLLLALFFAFYLLGRTYAYYQSNAKLYGEIDKAFYILNVDEIAFNLDSEKIVPSDDPYIYRFTISNTKDGKESDIDYNYNIKIRTTTNLPITFELYRNENYGDAGATNLLAGPVIKSDADGAWYQTFSPSNDFPMYYKNVTTDVYTLVVNFPKTYSENTLYADCIENIEIEIKSKQME